MYSQAPTVDATGYVEADSAKKTTLVSYDSTKRWLVYDEENERWEYWNGSSWAAQIIDAYTKPESDAKYLLNTTDTLEGTFTVEKNATTVNDENGIVVDMELNNTALSGANYTGVKSSLVKNSEHTAYTLTGVDGRVSLDADARPSLVTGLNGYVEYNGLNTSVVNGSLYGARLQAKVTNGGYFNHVIGLKINPLELNNGSSARSLVGIYINGNTGGANNNSAIHISGTGENNAITFPDVDGSDVPSHKIYADDDLNIVSSGDLNIDANVNIFGRTYTNRVNGFNLVNSDNTTIVSRWRHNGDIAVISSNDEIILRPTGDASSTGQVYLKGNVTEFSTDVDVDGEVTADTYNTSTWSIEEVGGDLVISKGGIPLITFKADGTIEATDFKLNP